MLRPGRTCQTFALFCVQDNETKKRQLEEDIDSLNEEISQLKATEEMNKVASDKREEDREMKEALEQQISQVHFRAKLTTQNSIV